MKITAAGKFWLPYILGLVLLVVWGLTRAQSASCDAVGAIVQYGPGAGSLTHQVVWSDACASEAQILMADSGFVWTNCTVSGTTMTGDVYDAYSSLIFAGRIWERTPVGCTPADPPTLPAWTAAIDAEETAAHARIALWLFLGLVLLVLFK